jgi:uncharacterized membrane protein
MSNSLLFANRLASAVEVLLLFLGLLATTSAAAQESAVPTGGDPVDFVKQIKPIFEQYCLKCHGPEKEEDFRIDDREAAMDYIIPGKAKESQMYTVLLSEDPEELMPPPDEKNPLKPEQIKLIEKWIDEGAKWPDGVEFKMPSEKQGGGEPAPATGGTAQQPSANPPQAGAQPILDGPVQEVPPKQATPTQSPPNQGTVGQTSDESAKDSAAGKKESTAGDKLAVAGVDDASKDKAGTQPSKKDYSVYNAIGSLHPAVLHLPVGLLFAAGLFGLIGIRGNFVMSDCAYYCLWLGTFGSVLACITGWWFSPMEGRGTVAAVQDLWNQQQPIFWHRTSALVITLFAVCLCFYARSARLRDPDDGFLWKLAALLLAGGIGFVGHNGGELTHGKSLYQDLYGLIEDKTGWDLDGN